MFRRLFGRDAYLRFAPAVWRDLFAELGQRAGGVRESGAFLLSAVGSDGRTVHHIVYYDDLDRGALRGGIRVDAAAYGRLWSRCENLRARVVGDVHTHPGRYVCQSGLDRENPMLARKGHVALVVPDLAARVAQPAEIGVHVYDGAGEWDGVYGSDAARRVYVGRFA